MQGVFEDFRAGEGMKEGDTKLGKLEAWLHEIEEKMEVEDAAAALDSACPLQPAVVV